MEYLIGIDAGTSKVKAVLFDLEGNEVKIESLDNEPLHLGEGRIEQDMNVLWEKVLLCIKNLFNDGINPKDVIGIGVSGQGEGCWLIDENGNPVDNSILWCDGRATDLVNKITKNKDDERALFSTTGTMVLTGTAATLLRWTKENKKENLDKAKNLLFCKDWIRYKLTGRINLELSDTATSLMDIQERVISDDVLKRLDIYEYKYLLSKILKPYEIAGSITEEIANETGLRKETPVGAGAIDVVAATVGIGAINSGDICTILGTTCSSNIVMDKATPGKECTRFEVHALEDLYLNLQATMSGTPNIDWLLDNISQSKDFKTIEEGISKVNPGCDGVIYHPYIGTSGERAPFYNPNARASFFGITTSTTRNHLIRAIYEGIAFSIKDCLKESKVEEGGKIYLAGGGAKSDVWAQIIADCTNREVITSFGNEIAAKGSAILIGIALGKYSNFKDAINKVCKFKKIYYPNVKNSFIYEELYKLYKDIRLSNNNLWNKRITILKNIDNQSLVQEGVL